MKILSIIPAFNEARNIVSVIESIKNEKPEIDVIVINDGSVDKTGDLAELSGLACVVNLPCNLGIGGAVQTGFKYAIKNNYDIVFQFDGDGQHIAAEIDKILDPIIRDEADVVIGSRFCCKHDGYKSTFVRAMGIKIFGIVSLFLIGQKITDSTSGFRSYNRRAIKFLVDNYSMDYPEPEAIILVGRNGLRQKEIFVQMQERINGISSISGSQSFYYMTKVLLAILVTALRPKILQD